MSLQIEARKIIVGALVLVVAHRWALFRAIVVPLSIGFAVATILDRWDHPIWSKLDYAFQFFVNTAIAVVTHRIIILGPEAVPPWGLRRWTSRESEFAAYLFGWSSCGLAVLALLFIPKLLFPAVMPAGIFVVWLLGMSGVAAWTLSRFSLVFPAIAIDEKISFQASWNLTQPVQRTTAIVVMGVPILLGVLIKVVGQNSVITWSITTVASAIVIVFEIAALSLLYREIYRNSHGRYPALNRDA